MKILQKYLGITEDGILGPNTLKFSELWARAQYEKLGLQFPKKGLIGLRQSQTFTDLLSDYCLIIKDSKCIDILPWTTKPGKPGVLNFLKYNKAGVGCLIENEPHVWLWSTEPNKYGAAMGKQYETIRVYRDGNKDNKLDKNIIEVAPVDKTFQLHAMDTKKFVGWWSLGCNGTMKSVWVDRVVPHFADDEKVVYCVLEM